MMRKTYDMVSRRVVGALASIALLLSLTMCETDFCNENMYVVGTSFWQQWTLMVTR